MSEVPLSLEVGRGQCVLAARHLHLAQVPCGSHTCVRLVKCSFRVENFAVSPSASAPCPGSLLHQITSHYGNPDSKGASDVRF